MTRPGTALTVGLVVILLLLGMPFATGIVAESRLNERVEQMNTNPALKAELLSYERGWLSSRAVVAVGLGELYLEQMATAMDTLPMLEALGGQLPVVVDIAHGPVTLQQGLALGMARVIARPDAADPDIAGLAQILGVPYLFEFRGRAGFGQRFDFDADVPPIDYAGPIGEVQFTGLELTGAASGPRLALTAGSERLTYQSPFANAALEALDYSLEYRARADGLPEGTAGLGIGRVIAASPMLGGAPLFEASDTRFDSSFIIDEAGEVLTMTAGYGVSAMSVGEDFAVSDAAIGVEIGNVDAAAAADYYALVRQAPPEELADPDLLLAAVEPLLGRVMARGPTLTVDPLHFTMPEGRLEASLGVSIAASGAASPPDFRNIAVLMGLLGASAEIEVDKPLAQRLATVAARAQIAAAGQGAEGPPPTPEELNAMAEAQAGFMLVTLAGQGILNDTGQRYTAQIELMDGALTVNGAPLPFGL